MKIIHFADAHIEFGADMGSLDPETHLSSRVLDCLDMIDSIIDFAEDEAADLIIFAGDAFHRYNPNPIYTNAFAQRINRMRNLCPVVLLVGNHDMSPNTSAVQIYDSLQIDNVYVGNDYQVHMIETKSGKVQVATAPFPSRRTLPGKHTKQALNDVIYHLGDTITTEFPAILVGHFTVSGSKFGVERSYILGEDAAVDLEVLTDVWDYVALGHLHYHQCLNEEPPVVYAGSVDRVTFGEEHEDKGFVCVDIVDGVTSWEFIKLDARPYVTLDIRTLKSDPMPKILAKIQSSVLSRAVVRVLIHVREDYVQRVDKTAILKLLEATDLCMLTSLVIYPIKAELATTRMEGLELTSDMSHMDMLKSYFEGIIGKSKDDREVLRLAAKIIQEVNNVSSSK